ncbi:MAG TPA: transposase [Terriglobia bacterium]|jgi:putative transposase
MPHRKRVVVSGIPVHIMQRGVRRSNIFRDKEDRCIYLRLFAEASRRFDLRIYAYCLMTNHTHFVAVPNRLDSIWRTFHRVHSIYGSIFNAKYGLYGRLWEERPRSTPTDETHFLAAVRYVELNPVRAGMIQRAEEYPWSSARFHCGLVATDLLLDATWPDAGTFGRWSEWLTGDCDPAMEDLLRQHTLSGQPCGDPAFIRQLEERTGQTIRPRKPGRRPRNLAPF